MQDSFLRAFIHIRKFDGRSSFSTWLSRIAINPALMTLRKKRSWRESQLVIPSHLGREPVEWEVVDCSANPEEGFAQRKIDYSLRAEIRDLRPTVRESLEIQKL